MANKLVSGKMYQVKVDGALLACQLDATLTLGQDMESEDSCKAEYTALDEGIVWQDDTPGNKNWEVSGSGKITDDKVVTLTTARTLAKHFITSDEPVEVSVGTVDTTLEMGITWSGTAQITSFTLNFPTTGSATYDYTMTGRGKLKQTETPLVP